ncbi:hypothetical protein K2173_009117 [Erythroxylum novogranatense]|uniref:Uncharacterized protein n=1 Tax=Erythroxylum novogranatense TaxID=1862640 RepID=A0AAV8TD81_9ROSI|nr:hypothetical protein K2173_009117 [Erythroxylum novogranatense]
MRKREEDAPPQPQLSYRAAVAGGPSTVDPEEDIACLVKETIELEERDIVQLSSKLGGVCPQHSYGNNASQTNVESITGLVSIETTVGGGTGRLAVVVQLMGRTPNGFRPWVQERTWPKTKSRHIVRIRKYAQQSLSFKATGVPQNSRKGPKGQKGGHSQQTRGGEVLRPTFSKKGVMVDRELEVEERVQLMEGVEAQKAPNISRDLSVAQYTNPPTIVGRSDISEDMPQMESNEAQTPQPVGDEVKAAPIGGTVFV